MHLAPSFVAQLLSLSLAHSSTSVQLVPLGWYLNEHKSAQKTRQGRHEAASLSVRCMTSQGRAGQGWQGWQGMAAQNIMRCSVLLHQRQGTPARHDTMCSACCVNVRGGGGGGSKSAGQGSRFKVHTLRSDVAIPERPWLACAPRLPLCGAVMCTGGHASWRALEAAVVPCALVFVAR